MGRKKTGFWILVIFFGLLALLGVGRALIDGTQISTHDATMGSTMGSMMKQEYGSHLTVAELLKAPEDPAAVAAMAKSHTPPQEITLVSDLTTAGIYALLPLVLGGVAMLLVLWL